MANINLLSSPSRVETPYIKVAIGEYILGVFDKTTRQVQGGIVNKIKYPNYIQSLSIEKINGAVNKYTLGIKYPITETNDPNFFEKIFSSVSRTRKIVFSYGDLSAPEYVYKDEEAIIIDVKQRLEPSSAVISYTVKAVSTGAMLSVGAHTFRGKVAKPSDEIKKLLYEKKYGLQEVFYGMSNKSLVESEGLIAADDVKVKLQTKTNISVIDYLIYLVNCMKSSASLVDSLTRSSYYSFIVVDDTSGKFKGPYFKIVKVDKAESSPSAYNLDIGFPSNNIVTSFEIDDDEGYSIFYDFQNKINDVQYVQRIDDEGNLIEEYAPILSSNTENALTNMSESTWWSRVTEYPIKAKITIKGLLRPAILMTHVRLNVLFFGRKHTSSGLYIITKQVDQIDSSGYRTTLNLLKIGKDKGFDEF